MLFKRPALFRRCLAAVLPLCAGAGGVNAQEGYGQWEFDRLRLPPEPKWAIELKSGDFEQELMGWDELYDDDTDHKAIAVGYKLLRAVEVGVEVGRMENNGSGQVPLAGAPEGDFQYKTRPTHLYLLLRMVYGEDQGAVPYFGGGKTRLSYELSVDGESVADDEADGSHWRAGLQFLLDRADKPGAADASRSMGIKNSYIFVEKQHIDVEADGVQIGGDTFFVGLMFEW